MEDKKPICCGVLEKMKIEWMVLEDGRKCMPYIKGKNNSVIDVSVTASQKAGYKRVTREIMNSIGPLFLVVRRITKPLIMKNNSTPRYPYLKASPKTG